MTPSMRQELSQAVLVGDAQRAQRILLHPLVDATEREIRRNEAEREAPAAALSAAQRLLRRSEQTEASCTGLRRAKERLLRPRWTRKWRKRWRRFCGASA